MKDPLDERAVVKDTEALRARAAEVAQQRRVFRVHALPVERGRCLRPANLPTGRELARNLLRLSLVHARLAAAGRPDQRLRPRDRAKALYAGGRQALAESIAHGRTVEDSADKELAEEARAQVETR